MKEQIKEVYDLGLEKFAGDERQAKEFTAGFLEKAAGMEMGIAANLSKGIGAGIGAGIGGLAIGLGIHGISSTLSNMNNQNLRVKYENALQIASRQNPLLVDADRQKLRSYADTIFKFAPNVSTDPNLLAPILAHAIQGEGMDITIVKNLTELENKLIESRKNSTFTPKTYQ